MKKFIQPLFMALAVIASSSLTACKTTKTVVIEEKTVRPSKPQRPADPGVNLEPVRKPSTFSPSY